MTHWITAQETWELAMWAIFLLSVIAWQERR